MCRCEHGKHLSSSTCEEHGASGTIHSLCRSHKWQEISLRLASNVNEAKVLDNFDSDTVLHAACRRDAPAEVIQKILSAAPDLLNWCNQRGDLPLHIVCRMHSEKKRVISLFVRLAPSTVAARDRLGRTPLFWLLNNTRTKHFPLESVKLLILANPATLFVRDVSGRLPIEHLCRWFINNVAVDGHRFEGTALPKHHPCHDFIEHCMKMFLDPAPETSFSTFDHVLHWTLGGSRRVLILRNTILRIVVITMQEYEFNGKHNMLLHHALHFDLSYAAIRVLLCDEQMNAKLSSAKDVDGNLPLHVALRRCIDERILKRIMAMNPNAAGEPDCEGVLPLHRAMEKKMSFDIVKCIVEAFPSAISKDHTSCSAFSGMNAALMAASCDMDLSVIQLLLAEDPSIVRGCDSLDFS